MVFGLLILLAVVGGSLATVDLPPPHLVLKYGLSPAGGPTGRTLTVGGIEFVELSAGYVRAGSHSLCDQIPKSEASDLVSRLIERIWPPRLHSGWCPPRWIEIGRAFWIARTEVTNAQFHEFNRRARHFPLSTRPNGPVMGLSVERARLFCFWLQSRAESEVRVRLPDRFEWEYACRAGKNRDLSKEDHLVRLSREAWFGLDTRAVAPDVGTKLANAWGLHDMLGGAGEVCVSPRFKNREKAFWEDVVRGKRPIFPLGTVHGGSFTTGDEYCRPFVHSNLVTSSWHPRLGIRPVLTMAVSGD